MIPRTLALILALAGSVDARAARTLSYDDALSAAVANNPQLAAAALQQEQAGADLTSALGTYDPVLALNGGYNRELSLQFQPPFPDPFQSITNTWNAGATVSASAPTGTSGSFSANFLNFRRELDLAEGGTFEQTFYQPSFRFDLSQELLRGISLAFNLQNVRTSREGVHRAELQAEKARQQALADTARAYWNWAYLWELAEISRQSVEIAEEDLRIGEARVEAGEAAPVERTRLQAALVQARSASLDATHNASQAADQLLLLMGEPPAGTLQPATSAGDAPVMTLDPDRAVDVALSQSLDVAIAASDLETAKLQLAAARHQTLPTLTANVNAGVSGGDADSWGSAFELLGGFPFVGVSGNFSVPLGNRAALGGKRRASAAVELAERALTDLRASTTAEVRQQVRLLQAAATKVELADANVRLAEETLAAEQALYEAGRSLLKTVLEARTEVERARAEAAKARTDHRLAEVELLRLQGQLRPPGGG